MEKKKYHAPSIRSLQIKEPLAYACTVYGMSGNHGTWTGPNLFQEPTVNC